MAVDILSEVNWIIHAAGTPDNRIHASEPLRTINTIINGTDTILSACTRLPNLQKFLNISSGLVYGMQPWEMNKISEIIFFIISSFAPKILTSKGVRINQQTKSKKMLQKVYLNVLFRTFDINYILGKAKTLIYLDCVYDNNLCECNHCDVQPIGAHKCQYLSY